MKSISQDEKEQKGHPGRGNHLTKAQSCAGKSGVAMDQICMWAPYPTTPQKKKEKKKEEKRKEERRRVKGKASRKFPGHQLPTTPPQRTFLPFQPRHTHLWLSPVVEQVCFFQ